MSEQLTEKQQEFFNEKLKKHIKSPESYTIFLCLFGFFGLHRLYLNQHTKGLAHFVTGAVTYSLFIYSATNGHDNKILFSIASAMIFSLIVVWIFDLIKRKSVVLSYNEDLTRKLFEYCQNLEIK